MLQNTTSYSQTMANALYYQTPVPYYLTSTGEPAMSKTETAMKVISKLIEEGYIEGEKITVAEFLSLVAKLVEEAL